MGRKKSHPRVKERDHYRTVVEFLRGEDFNCFFAKESFGARDVGIADAGGIRDVGGQYASDIEIIAVEVKVFWNKFATSLGQARGYSLFAHRCYLAIPFYREKKFRNKHKEMATAMGVGLIEIESAEGPCREVLTAPRATPIERIMRRVLWLNGYARCIRCGSYFEIGRKTKVAEKALREGTTFYVQRRLSAGGRRRILAEKGGKMRSSRYEAFCDSCLKLEFSSG